MVANDPPRDEDAVVGRIPHDLMRKGVVPIGIAGRCVAVLQEVVSRINMVHAVGIDVLHAPRLESSRSSRTR
jgi:hypothetical protein